MPKVPKVPKVPKMPKMPMTPPDPAQVRRGRLFLSILGAFLVLVAVYLGPSSEGGASYGALVLGFFGVLLGVVAVFASDRLVNVMQTLLTGWP